MSRHWVLASLLDSLAAAPAPPTDPVKSEFPKQNSQKIPKIDISSAQLRLARGKRPNER
jgi:hypothetical protein